MCCKQEYEGEITAASVDPRIPTSFKQILLLPEEEKEKWLEACRQESESHLAIPSISKPLPPPGYTAAPAIRLTWVFTIKPSGDYKARIVILGQGMNAGLHFNDAHAPVPSPTMIRAFLALVAAGSVTSLNLMSKLRFSMRL